jgi:hypothetical protein
LLKDLYCATLLGSTNYRPMPRYALKTTHEGKVLYLAAYYANFPKNNGIRLTYKAEDACSYVTIEKACQVARSLEDSMGCIPSIVEVSY